jgi:hypothetical protein
MRGSERFGKAQSEFAPVKPLFFLKNTTDGVTFTKKGDLRRMV